MEPPELLSAAERVIEDKDTEEDLRLLFGPGSSLSGARPKASVIDRDGHLALTKAEADRMASAFEHEDLRLAQQK